jgi:6-phosphogluconolactonase (cycloisomerase 2 family)
MNITYGFRGVVVALLLMASVSGCSDDTASTAPTPAPTTFSPRFGFEVNRGDDTLSVYLINAATGQWLHHGYVLTGATPVAVAVTPNENYVYVLNQVDETVSGFTLDADSGRLSLIGAPIATGTNPSALAVTPSGSWLYVVNSGTSALSGYSIDSVSGALSAIDTDAVTGGVQPTIGSGGTTPVALAMHPTLPLLYVINSGTNTITAFSYSPSTGALTAADVSSAVGIQLTFTVGTNPSELALDHSGKFLYVANQVSNDVSAFSVDSTTGVLTAAGTTLTGAASGPRSVTVHPGGAYVYTANGTTTGTVSIFSVNTTSGALTLVTGTLLSTVADPRSLRADPSGNFLFVTSETEQVGQAYRVNTTSGALTALGVTRTRAQPVALAMSTGTGALSPQVKHAYVVNATDSQTRVYSVDTTSGALSDASDASTGLLPKSIAVDPFSRFAYVVNNGNDSLSGYSINDTTGSLILIDLDPGLSNDLFVGFDPQHVVVDPSGRFLYVSLTTAAATGQVRGYTIAADGALTEVTGSPYTVGADPKQLTVDPTGQYLYVVNQDRMAAVGSVSAFSIDNASGQLTSLGAAVVVGSYPEAVTIEPTGRFAYVGNRGATDSGTTLTRFDIALDGTLSSPGTTSTETGPVDLAMDPLGRFAYVAAVNPPRLAGYEIASNDGILTSIGTPTLTAPTPACMEIDPTGRFAYVGYVDETYVSVYDIDSTGNLSPSSTAYTVGSAVSLALSRRLVTSSSSSDFWR